MLTLVQQFYYLFISIIPLSSFRPTFTVTAATTTTPPSITATLIHQSDDLLVFLIIFVVVRKQCIVVQQHRYVCGTMIEAYYWSHCGVGAHHKRITNNNKNSSNGIVRLRIESENNCEYIKKKERSCNTKKKNKKKKQVKTNCKRKVSGRIN